MKALHSQRTPGGAVEEMQRHYFDEDLAYLDPRHPTARAFALPKLDFVSRHLPTVQSVLDIGAGNGTFTYHWRQRAQRVAGLELSRRLIARSPTRPRLFLVFAVAPPGRAP